MKRSRAFQYSRNTKKQKNNSQYIWITAKGSEIEIQDNRITSDKIFYYSINEDSNKIKYNISNSKKKIIEKMRAAPVEDDKHVLYINEIEISVLKADDCEISVKFEKLKKRSSITAKQSSKIDIIGSIESNNIITVKSYDTSEIDFHQNIIGTLVLTAQGRSKIKAHLIRNNINIKSTSRDAKIDIKKEPKTTVIKDFKCKSIFMIENGNIVSSTNNLQALFGNGMIRTNNDSYNNINIELPDTLEEISTFHEIPETNIYNSDNIVDSYYQEYVDNAPNISARGENRTQIQENIEINKESKKYEKYERIKNKNDEDRTENERKFCQKIEKVKKKCTACQTRKAKVISTTCAHLVLCKSCAQMEINILKKEQPSRLFEENPMKCPVCRAACIFKVLR